MTVTTSTAASAVAVALTAGALTSCGTHRIKAVPADQSLPLAATIAPPALGISRPPASRRASRSRPVATRRAATRRPAPRPSTTRPTVTVHHLPAVTSAREQVRPSPSRTHDPAAGSSSAGVPEQLLRIRSCESGPNGRATGGRAHDVTWTAANPDSTASGGYQELDSTWNGYGGFSRAMDAPPSVQTDKAMAQFRDSGGTPWAASQSCWGS